MVCEEVSKEDAMLVEESTSDGSATWNGKPAIRVRSGGWEAGIIILLNQGLATLAFFGVGVNLVLFLTKVLHQDNADAANNVSKWTGTVYIFSLVGAFLSDSYLGRYNTCVIFQAIFVVGLASLSLSTYFFLDKPKNCGYEDSPCRSHSMLELSIFNLSIYLIALGNGGYQPNIATFGADQFDEGDPEEGKSKTAFFSYFYLALNLGSLFSNTILGYFEDAGQWSVGFFASTGSAFVALILFLGGTFRYRHVRPGGNPISRCSQVIVSAMKKWKVQMSDSHTEFYDPVATGTKLVHSHGFKFLDRAAYISSRDLDDQSKGIQNSWRLCSISQVEELKCILRLLPIWLCTIIYSVVFTQMASLFVEQGAAMKTSLSNFHVPPASMSSFDILSVALFIFLYRRFIDPLAKKLMSRGLTELERMGIGLVIAIFAMLAAGTVEIFRLRHARKDCEKCEDSSLSIFWQAPQYALIGASEVFMYVGQLEFFNSEAPDGLKSFGSALCMASISLGNYVSDLLVIMVTKISSRDDDTNGNGWIPGNLNKGHLDRFYFLLGALTCINLAVYVATAKWYESTKQEEKLVDKDVKIILV